MPEQPDAYFPAAAHYLTRDDENAGGQYEFAEAYEPIRFEEDQAHRLSSSYRFVKQNPDDRRSLVTQRRNGRKRQHGPVGAVPLTLRSAFRIGISTLPVSALGLRLRSTVIFMSLSLTPGFCGITRHVGSGGQEISC